MTAQQTGPPTAAAESGESLATLRGIGLSYPNGTSALEGLNLEVKRGEILGVTGPSGCGKSSLLSLLAKSRAPSTGKIAWNDPDEGTGHALAMMFQKDTLLPWLTVGENANVYRRLNRKRVPDNTEHVQRLLELVGLDHVKSQYPNQLSGGMRRRLAFVSALAARPRLLLLDEPFSALDEPTRVGIHQDVLDILKSLETTVVLVTHDLAEATTLCDRVVILSKGPGHVAHCHQVPLTSDRSVLEMRERPDFLSFYGRLWHDLSAEIARDKKDD